jgi:hypothetical protein
VSVDRRGINVLLAALDVDQRELAERMGYRPGYVANVFKWPSTAVRAQTVIVASYPH